MVTATCSHAHNALHCMVPPYLLERLAHSPTASVREWAIKNLTMSATLRSRRATMAGPEVMQAMQLGARALVVKKSRTVYDAKGDFRLPGTLAREEGDPPSNDAIVNEAYTGAGYVYDFYKKFYARNSLDDRGMRIISSVHVGEGGGSPMSNAFWDGTQIAYGDGDGQVFVHFTRALDVVAHELTHGVTSYSSNLIYQGQSGALNEHFSDVFGVLVRQWRKKQNAAKANWLIGDDILVKTSTRRALRDMENPGTAFKNDPDLGDDPQPAHMKKLFRGAADNGGVHINSGIPNRAFVLAAQTIGGNAWEITGKIWYDTLLQLKAAATFADCAKLNRKIAAAQSKTSGAAVDKAWKAVGL
jgi:Zn-dependent metalloprotease